MRNKNPVAKNSHVNRAATFDDRQKKVKKGHNKHKVEEKPHDFVKKV
jgi:hypothetical protein